ADDSGLAEEDEGAGNGIGHAAAGFAGGFGELGKERPVDRREPLFEEMIKNEDQRDDHEHGAAQRDDLHQHVLELAPVVIGGGHEMIADSRWPMVDGIAAGSRPFAIVNRKS